ncbi:hypothetical protein [Desulfoluna butyratoxydans]|uniref:Uncharacterized protein n=1 Tax=Desulfoluna butyratoxydans TaxID=231438 RepID=A0A4U8YQ48_9BACT|nr:hypothetical protein [Desulfoluna butyratoxydans]VFQ43842.1 hypothetical protein MSL71_14830 [Desulfoluna butyratoxydans]
MQLKEINVIRTVLGIIYRTFVRKSLKKAVDDPSHVWDDIMMGACDAVFGNADKPNKPE